MRIENKKKNNPISKNALPTIIGSLMFIGVLFFGSALPTKPFLFWAILAATLVIIGSIGEASKEIVEALEKTRNTSKSRETSKNRQTSQ